VATASGGPYTATVQTADKVATGASLTGLAAGTTYYVAVRTFTPAHGFQQNALLSPYGAEVTLTVPAPTPTLTALSPVSAQQGGAQFTLTVQGTGFLSTSVVHWDAVALATTLVSSGRLTAVVPAAQIAAARTVLVQVDTPVGGRSNALPFFVTEAQAGVTDYDAASGTGGTVSASTEHVSATGTGSGTLVVAEYAAAPVLEVPFAVAGHYFDVYISPDSTLSALRLEVCGLAAGAGRLQWWDGDTWAAVTPQSLDKERGCLGADLSATSVPRLADLAGTPLAVENVRPTVDAGADLAVAIGDDVLLAASFRDEGLAETHVATIDWGDGHVGAGAVDEVRGAITGQHVYAAAGQYSVLVTVRDQEGSTASDTLVVTVGRRTLYVPVVQR